MTLKRQEHMTKREAIATARAAVGRAKPPPPRRDLPEPLALPSHEIVRDEAEWQRRERWIVHNGAAPLPKAE